MARTLHSGCRGRPFKSDHPDLMFFVIFNEKTAKGYEATIIRTDV